MLHRFWVHGKKYIYQAQSSFAQLPAITLWVTFVYVSNCEHMPCTAPCRFFYSHRGEKTNPRSETTGRVLISLWWLLFFYWLYVFGGECWSDESAAAHTKLSLMSWILKEHRVSNFARITAPRPNCPCCLFDCVFTHATRDLFLSARVHKVIPNSIPYALDTVLQGERM